MKYDISLKIASRITGIMTIHSLFALERIMTLLKTAYQHGVQHDFFYV